MADSPPQPQLLYRAWRDEDCNEHALAIAEAFATSPEGVPTWVKKVGPDQVRMVEANDHFAATALMLPMGQFFGGREVPMIGVAGVTVRPEQRGAGVGSFLMEQLVREMATLAPISTLYPSTRPLYRKVGFESAGTWPRFTIPLARLPRRRHRLKLRLFEPGPARAEEGPPCAEPATLAALRSWSNRLAVHRNGALARRDYIWDRIHHSRFGAVRTYLIESADGTLRGWVALRQVPHPTRERHDLEVQGLEAADPEAIDAVIDLLGSYRSMAEEVRLPLPPQHPLIQALPETRAQMQVREIWMTRILDLPAALEARGYPAALRATLRLAVDDPLLSTNQGVFELAVQDGQAHCRQVEGAPPNEAPLRLDIGALASLYTSFSSPCAMMALGRLQGSTEAAATLATLFAGPAPWCPDLF